MLDRQWEECRRLEREIEAGKDREEELRARLRVAEQNKIKVRKDMEEGSKLNSQVGKEIEDRDLGGFRRRTRVSFRDGTEVVRLPDGRKAYVTRTIERRASSGPHIHFPL